MKIISVTEMRKNINKLLDGEEIVLLTNHYKIVGLLIPFNLEDSLDIITAQESIRKDNFIRWENVKKTL